MAMNIENNISKQKGATLIVALVLLALMTIIGLSSMDTSTIDVKIVANSKDRQLAFNGAESVLFQAGRVISETICELDSTVTPEYVKNTYISDRDFWKDASNWTLAAVTGTDTKADYIIEKYIDGPTGGMDNREYGAMKYHYYPVIAKAEGPGSANVVLQSHFVKKPADRACLN